jgi:DNA topoisomerase-1
MRLVIVESPSKTQRIAGFLGPGYRVAASFGHVRDLPAAGDLAVGFAGGRVLPRYQAMEKSANAIAHLRALAAKADEILLATDPDREGEAIAWHLTQVIGQHRYQRVAFHAITAAEIRRAVAAPRALDQALVDAQQARRVLDRVVGWLVSPTLRPLGRDARSAGRVQSVALRIVAEREREIAKFTAVDYFVPAATLTQPGNPPPFRARLIAWKGEPLEQRLNDRALAERTVDWCRRQPWVVERCDRRTRTRRPPPPFTTATVQQAASVRLKLAPDRTMALLQQLFEGGHITYHRTDAVALAPEAVAAARAIIARDHPKPYLPAQPVTHATSAGNAQEAHEAIRPTHPESGPAAADIPAAAAELYQLIWLRFIACQMADAVDEVTTIDVGLAPGTWIKPDGAAVAMGVFQAQGVVPRFDGWRRLGQDATDEDGPKKKPRKTKAKAADEGAVAASKVKKKTSPDDDDGEQAAVLPLVQVGTRLDLVDLDLLARTTRPPPRYTQAALIKLLEREGIGRPSTYAAILATLFKRAYVTEAKRLLHATPLGLAVTDFLVARFGGNFIERDYTARMEHALDAVARGERPWEALVTQAAHSLLKLAQAAGLRGDPLAP